MKMSATKLVLLAAFSALFLTSWHHLASERKSRSHMRTNILAWPTVPPLPIPAIWLDTGGNLDSQILKRFVNNNAKKFEHRQHNNNETITAVNISTNVQPRLIKTNKIKASVNRITGKHHSLASCPKAPVVAAQDGGRLGNKAWEYAAVWSLSKLLGRSGYVPASMLNYLNHVFANLSLKTVESISHCNNLQFTEPVKRYQLMPLKMIPLRYGNQSLLLHKWMQLPDPILMYRNQLRKEFTFLPVLTKFVKNTFENINSKYKKLNNITYIGVHVRRTDFKTWLPMKYNITFVGAQYFLDAMTWFRKELKEKTLLFLIVTDDPQWCKKEIVSRVKDAILISRVENPVPGQDLALLASCDHSIIDYGTFGEFGAFLAYGYSISHGVDAYFNNFASKILNWKIWKNL